MNFNDVTKASHYNQHPSGIECRKLTELLPANLSKAVDYVWRHQLKGNPKQDLEKALMYLTWAMEESPLLTASPLNKEKVSMLLRAILKAEDEHQLLTRYFFFWLYEWNLSHTEERLKDRLSKLRSAVETLIDCLPQTIPQPTPKTEIIWSADNNNFNYFGLSELLKDIPDAFKVGDTVYKGLFEPFDPANLFAVDALLEQVSENAYGEFGECLEGYIDDGLPTTDKSISDLENRIGTWLRDNWKGPRVTFKSFEKYTLTAADFEAANS